MRDTGAENLGAILSKGAAGATEGVAQILQDSALGLAPMDIAGPIVGRISEQSVGASVALATNFEEARTIAGKTIAGPVSAATKVVDETNLGSLLALLLKVRLKEFLQRSLH